MISRRVVARYAARVLVQEPTQRSALINELAAYVAEGKQPGQLALLIQDIAREIERQFGVVDLHIVSAHKLSGDLTSQITKLIAQRSQAKDVVVTTDIDRRLLGGFVATTPSHALDLSVRSRLQALVHSA